MSKLTNLVERLKALPERKRLRNASQTMKVFRDRIVESGGNLKRAIETCRAVGSIVGDDQTLSVMIHVKKASRKASTLLKRLSPIGLDDRYDTEAIVATVIAKKSDNTVTEIGEHTKQASKEIKEIWQVQLEERVAPYRQLCIVAQRLPVRGGDALAATLHRLDSQKTEPPSTTAAAESLKKDIETLKTSIETLGLQGEAGKFLIRAAEGQGDPRALFKDEVKSFFENDPKLWKLLRVTLG